MEPTVAGALERLVARAKDDPDVLAVILFGSHARGEAGPKSDVDVCVVLARDRDVDLASRKQVEYAGEFDLDVAAFQRLPLYIRSRVLKEGKVLFVRDEEALYDLAVHTARAFELFRPIYRRYLDEVARD